MHFKFRQNKQQHKQDFKQLYKLINTGHISKVKAKSNKLEYGRNIRLATLNVRGLTGKKALTKREQIEKI